MNDLTLKGLTLKGLTLKGITSKGLTLKDLPLKGLTSKGLTSTGDGYQLRQEDGTNFDRVGNKNFDWGDQLRQGDQLLQEGTNFDLN